MSTATLTRRTARKTFGERFREIRKEKGLSPSQVAQLLGLRAHTVAIWERDPTKAPNSSRVSELCRVTGCQEFELELLELAHADRKTIVLEFEHMSDSVMEAFTLLEKHQRENGFTDSQAESLCEVLCDLQDV